MYDLKYCKLCLVTNVKISSMNALILRAYSELLRLPLFNHEPYVCYECEALLRKYQEFHSKCSRAHDALTAIMSRNSKLTKEAIRKINRKRYNLESKIAVSSTTVHNNQFQEPGEYNNEEEKYFMDDISTGVDHQLDNKEIDEVKISDYSDYSNVYVISDTESESGDHLADFNDSFTTIGLNINDNVQNVVPKKKMKPNNPIRNKTKTSRVKTKKDKITVPKVKQEKITTDKFLSELNVQQISTISSDTTDTVKYEVTNNEELIKNKLKPDERTVKDVKKYVKRRCGPKFNTSFFEGYATVVLLTTEEAKNEVLVRKESRNYINCTYKCDLCYKGFEFKKTHENHQKRHSLEYGALECEYCHLRFPIQRLLTKHTMTCHSRKFSCKICSYVCFSPSQAKSHIGAHKGNRFNCEDCGKHFNRLNSMLMHRRLNHATDCVCELCGSTFSTERGLGAHKKLLHRQETNEGNGPNCEECGVQFATETAWKRHLVLSTKHKVSNGCEFCGEVFSNVRDLKKHVLEHTRRKQHRMKLPTSCTICSQWLTSRNEYKSHMTSQHPLSEVARRIKADEKMKCICEVCGKEFKAQCFLIYHQRKHTGERPYECDECGKRYSFAGALSAHKRKHRPKTTHQCHMCPKVLTTRSSYLKHVKNHLGHRPHKCAICNKAFQFACDLKLHKRYTHDKVPWPKRDRSKRRDVPNEEPASVADAVL